MPNPVLEHLEQWARIRSGRDATSQTRRLRDERKRVNRKRVIRRLINTVDENGGISTYQLMTGHGFSYEDVRICIDAGYIKDCKKWQISCLHVTADGDAYIERKQK